MILCNILSRLKIDENECLTSEQKIEVKALIIEYADLFCEDEPSVAQGVVHVIETGSARPIYLSPYRASPKERQVIEQEIEKMLSNHIICQSRSPWSFPCVLVKKKDNSVRFCVDYCRLNEVTKRDMYPLPRTDDAIDALSSANIFSTFDLKSAYWQIKMAEHDIEKTAFITHTGLFEFLVMPYGLVNGQATLQRQVDNLLAGLLWIICLCFVDDLNVFSKTFTDHLHHLGLVFDRFWQGNLKFNPDKSNLFKESTQYLGYIAMKGRRVQPDPKKIEAVQQIPVPTCVRDIRSFLGLASYYKRFIRNFAAIAKPLREATCKNVKFQWTPEMQATFELLKKKLMTVPVLVSPNFELPFLLETDASEDGL